MSTLHLELDDGRRSYEPGELLAGTIAWKLPAPALPASIELHLIWHTTGKGTTDSQIAVTRTFAATETRGEERFELELPQFPYSFSGALTSLLWTLEAIVAGSEEPEQIDLVIAPHGREVIIARPQEEAVNRDA